MPQELRVVKCFRCLRYQGDIVKKAKQWTCKMCGAKQTLKQEFGRGSGAECRKLVQQLNMKKQEFEQIAHEVVQKIIKEEIELPDFLLEENRPEDGIPERNQRDQQKPSKWDTFAESSEEESDSSNLLEQNQSPTRGYKRKSLSLPEIPEVSEMPQPQQPKSSLFNFNKKSKLQFDVSSVSSSQVEELKPKIVTKPNPLNPNSKWGNFLSNSDEECD